MQRLVTVFIRQQIKKETVGNKLGSACESLFMSPSAQGRGYHSYCGRYSELNSWHCDDLLAI